jgi:hypothetical protein
MKTPIFTAALVIGSIVMMQSSAQAAAQSKLFLVSYLGAASSNDLNPSVAGGNWAEVGTFSSTECDTFAGKVTSHDYGGFSPAASGLIIKAVCVPISE